MRYTASFAGSVGETRIELASNCYTDAFPMLSRLFLRKLPVDLRSPSLALAMAILTADCCGTQFEFPGPKIGEDYAEAIRLALGRDVNILNVDGLNRALATGEQDVLVGRAGSPVPAISPIDSTPMVRLDWSGDFVDATTATSAGFFFGAVQTNALYFADEARVSIAIGLIALRERCRNIVIARPAAGARALGPVAEALRVVGISLQIV